MKIGNACKCELLQSLLLGWHRKQLSMVSDG